MLERGRACLLAGLLPTVAGGCGQEQAPPTASPPAAIPASLAASDVALCTRRQIEIEGRPEGLLAGDLDGDGTRDLAAVTFSPGAIHLWRGRPGLASRGRIAAAGLRAPDAVTAVGDYPLEPIALEGKDAGSPPIVAVASRADRKLRLVDLRAGAVVRTIDLPATPRAIAAGDVDGDGRTELAIAADGRLLLVVRDGEAIEERTLSGDLPRCVRVLAGVRAVAVGFQDTQAIEVLGWPGPDGGTALSGVLLLAGMPRDLDEADLDGDGDLELVVAGGERSAWIFGLGAQGGARAWIGDDGAPAREPLELDAGTVPIALLPADFDADGTDDLLVLAQHGVRWSIWSGSGKGPPRLLQQAYAGQTPCSAALVDLDGDGRLDLATANRDSHAISVFQGLPGTSFAAPVAVGVGSFPISVSARDLGGQGPLGIAAVLAKDAALSVIGSDRLEKSRLPLGSSPRALACGDLDGDHHDEAAAIVRDATSSRVVAISLSDSGGESWRLEARLGRGGSDLVHFPGSGGRPASLLAADPDGDEIVWIRARPESPSGLTLEIGARITVPSGPRALAAVRVGDAKEPAVAVALGGPGARTGLAILRWKPDGLEEWRFFPAPGAHRDVAAGDLDGDGREDLVLLSLERADGASGWIEPWLQVPSDGGGPSFAPGARSKTTARPQSIAVGDLDADGRAEILCASLESHVVDAWKTAPLRAGEPFALRRLPGVGAGLGCADVRIADVDRDGRAEILVADSANDEVSVIFPLGP